MNHPELIPVKYEIPDTRDYKRGGFGIFIDDRGKGKWAIVNGFGDVLNKDGEWEWEPQPSSRDAAFFERCRYSSAAEAYQFYLKYKENTENAGNTHDERTHE